MIRLYAILSGAGLCGALVAPTVLAQGEAGYFVVNRFSTPISRIQLAVAGTDKWGPNLLGDRVVGANGRFRIMPPAGACVVDVRVVYKDNRIEVQRARNVCGSGEIAFDGSKREDAMASPPESAAPTVLQAGSAAATPDAPAAPSVLEALAIRGLAVQVTTRLPSFPWPPPEPSARAELSSNIFSAAGKPAPSLAAIGAQLVGVLDQAKYPEYSYYGAPGGFALVARLERMSNDGTPLPEQFRFLQPGSAEPFSLSVYVKQLFFAPEGFYRQIVFVISDQPFTATGQKIDAKDAQQLLRGGMNRLPREFEAMPFTAQHRASALIYEFKKGSRDGDVATLTPGRLAARTHLERAGLYQALTKTSR